MSTTVSFPGLGIGEFSVDRVAFELFGKPIYWYGVIIATGFTVASGKMLVVIAFLWLTSPVSGPLIGRMEITINDAEALDSHHVAGEGEEIESVGFET